MYFPPPILCISPKWLLLLWGTERKIPNISDVANLKGRQKGTVFLRKKQPKQIKPKGSRNHDFHTGHVLDCEQSLFFFSFSESNARARERRSRETRETRAAAREEKRETARLARANELSVGLTTQNMIGWFVILFFRASPVSRHQSRAWPFACLAFCSTDHRKKRDCS